MKDPLDLSTADLILPPKLGRPRSGNALSNSEKQKAYRQRNKLVGKKQILFDPLELGLLRGLVEDCVSGPGADCRSDVYAPLLAKIVAACEATENAFPH